MPDGNGDSVPPVGLTDDARYVDTTIVKRAAVEPHKCHLPRSWERRRRGIRPGDVIRCNECGRHYRWQDVGWTYRDMSWHPVTEW